MFVQKKLNKLKIEQVIEKAEKLLPGVPAPDNELDPRWQAIIEIGEYIPSYPGYVWNFIKKWGKHPSKDLRTAIATCLLEHLLEYHFDEFFPLIKEACQQSKRFRFTLHMAGQFGQANLDKNSKVFMALRDEFDI